MYLAVVHKDKMRRRLRGMGGLRESAAAASALETGEEADDVLMLSRRRLDGANVRRQLQRHQSSKRGSMRFLQSMRFWESIRPKGRNSSISSSPSAALDYNGGHTSQHPQHRLDAREKMMDQKRLLSMRCEASRSMRRQRNGPSLIDWLKEEPKAAAAAIKDKKIPWRRKPDKLQRKNLQRMEQAPDSVSIQDEVDADMDAGADADEVVYRGIPNNTKPSKKQNKKTTKRWRLWLPNQKEPIELVHPNSSFEGEASTCSSPGYSKRTNPLPAHVQLKQSLARQQKQTLSERGSRHLERQLDSSEHDGDNDVHRSFQCPIRASRRLLWTDSVTFCVSPFSESPVPNMSK